MTAMRLHRYPSPSGGIALGKMGVGATMLKQGKTARDYVQDGLIAMWDGIENAGWGKHTADKNQMFELVSHTSIDVYEQLPSISSIAVGEDALDFERADFTTLYSRALCSLEIPGLGDTIKSAEQLTLETVCIPDTSFQTEYATQRWGLSFQIGAASGALGDSNSCFRRWWQEGMMCAAFNGRLYRAVSSSHPAPTTPTMMWWQQRRSTALVANYKSSVSAARYYVDGEQLQNASFEDFWVGSTTVGDYIVFGTRGTAKERILPSRVYAVRLYSRALTADEIAANYAIDKERFNLP